MLTERLLYSSKTLRQLERLCYTHFHISPFDLMQRAGALALKALQRHWPTLNKLAIFCGTGNNAGDGYVLAALAKQAGYAVAVYQLGEPLRLPEPASFAYQVCVAGDVLIQAYTPGLRLDAELIVDALLGIGLRGEVSGDYALAIQTINQAAQPVFALDIPSGLAADTGVVQGLAVKATLTLSFIGFKQGLFIADALDHCGRVLCEPLALPESLFAQVTPSGRLLSLGEVQQLLPKRKRNVHKGSFGHVLVVGGDYGMAGAVRLAGEAAARIGAGLVTVATRPEHITAINAARPELLCFGISVVQELLPLIARASVLVLGPGLGQSQWGRALFERVLASAKPKLLDADALNLLANENVYRSDWILTPHPGEAARLLQTTIAQVQADRLAAVKQLQAKFGGIAVLKGAGSIISDGQEAYVCSAGNPGMASGGMGDVLSGMIGGLLAQGLSLSAAACAGVTLHAQAGDEVARRQGERGTMALDLLSPLGYLINH